MTKQTLMIAGLAVGALALLALRNRMSTDSTARALRGESAATPAALQSGPSVVYDFFGSRSADEVLSNPGQLYRDTVMNYPDEAYRRLR